MYKRLSDKLLMEKVIDDDMSAKAELYQRFHSYVVAYFRKSLFDKDVSYDLSQIVFEKVLKYKTTYNGEAKLKTWIYVICRNVKIDYLNQKRSESVKLEGFRRNSDLDEDDGASSVLNENLVLLRKAISRLEENEREIITLGKLENLNYEEISDLMGITQSNVKVKIFRAMKSLKREYDSLIKKQKL